MSTEGMLTEVRNIGNTSPGEPASATDAIQALAGPMDRGGSLRQQRRRAGDWGNAGGHRSRPQLTVQEAVRALMYPSLR